jgi:uncharacterized membrane protein
MSKTLLRLVGYIGSAVLLGLGLLYSARQSVLAERDPFATIITHVVVGMAACFLIGYASLLIEKFSSAHYTLSMCFALGMVFPAIWGLAKWGDLSWFPAALFSIVFAGFFMYVGQRRAAFDRTRRAERKHAKDLRRWHTASPRRSL